jgi:hypothetical protein
LRHCTQRRVAGATIARAAPPRSAIFGPPCDPGMTKGRRPAGRGQAIAVDCQTPEVFVISL